MTIEPETEGLESLERRRFIKYAAHAAWAVPAIVTLSAAEPAYAQTCVPAGGLCGTHALLDPCIVTATCCSALVCTAAGGLDCTCQ